MLQREQSKQKPWAYTSPDAKHSDDMAWPIVALKDAARHAFLLQSKHLVILVVSRNLCKPSPERSTCTHSKKTRNTWHIAQTTQQIALG